MDSLGESGGVGIQASTSPLPFIGMTPCRLLDTRTDVNPLGGGGPFAADEIRTYTLPGACGLPGTMQVVSLNVTATNTGSGAFGHIKIWPADQAEPNVSTLNYPGAGATVANAAVVPLSATGALKVKSGNVSADVILDVNGYYAPAPTSTSTRAPRVLDSNDQVVGVPVGQATLMTLVNNRWLTITAMEAGFFDSGPNVVGDLYFFSIGCVGQAYVQNHSQGILAPYAFGVGNASSMTFYYPSSAGSIMNLQSYLHVYSSGLGSSPNDCVNVGIFSVTAAPVATVTLTATPPFRIVQ